MISCLAPTIECPHSINSFGGCSECYTAMNCIVMSLNCVLGGQSSQSVHMYNFPNMEAMSYRCDFFPCSCRVNISEPAVCITLLLLSAVSQVGSSCVLILTTMSDSKPLNTFGLEVMISSKNESVCIRDLSDLTSQIIFDAWWALMHHGSKRPITCNNSRYALSW
jgi:hypothetical protein